MFYLYKLSSFILKVLFLCCFALFMDIVSLFCLAIKHSLIVQIALLISVEKSVCSYKHYSKSPSANISLFLFPFFKMYIRVFNLV